MFHVDESADGLYHFHGGVLVEARSAAKAAQELDDLIEEAHDAGICGRHAELHADHIFHGRDGWKGSVSDRATVFLKALEVLRRHDIEVIAHGANLRSLRKTYGASFDPYRWEFRNMLERLNERLRTRDEYAVVIADHHAKYRTRIQQDVIDCRSNGTGGYRDQKLTRIVDTAHFVDSRLSRMTQLADLVVFTLRRRTSFPHERCPKAEAIQAELERLVVEAIPHPQATYRTVRS